jgi:hypothetical protein
MSKVLLLVPEAPAPASGPVVERRKGGKKDFRLGILDNSKSNADHLLRFVMEGIQGELPVTSVVWQRKGNVSLPASKDILDKLSAEADFVVTAMAD